MYAENIAKAAQALLDKEAPAQKVKQWKRDGRKTPCATPAKLRQLRRLFKYQLAAASGKMWGWFL